MQHPDRLRWAVGIACLFLAGAALAWPARQPPPIEDAMTEPVLPGVLPSDQQQLRETLEIRRQQSLRRNALKEAVINDFIDGRLSFDDAVAQFREIGTLFPELLQEEQHYYTLLYSDLRPEDYPTWNVIFWTANRLQSYSNPDGRPRPRQGNQATDYPHRLF